MSKKSAQSLPKAELASLAERLKEVVEACGGRAKAAQIAEIGQEQIRRIALGESLPAALTLRKLATSSGYSMDWIMTGLGPRRTMEPRWVTVDDAAMRDTLERAGAALTQASEAKSPTDRFQALFSYLRLALEPRLRRLYFEAGLPFSDVLAEKTTEHALQTLARGVPENPLFTVGTWPAVLDAIVLAHEDALMWSLTWLERPKQLVPPVANKKSRRL